MDLQTRLSELMQDAEHPAFRWLGRLVLGSLDELRPQNLEDLATDPAAERQFSDGLLDAWAGTRGPVLDHAEETYLQTREAIFVDHVRNLYMADPSFRLRMRAIFAEPPADRAVRRAS
jgi:hypothetical protein